MAGGTPRQPRPEGPAPWWLLARSSRSWSWILCSIAADESITVIRSMPALPPANCRTTYSAAGEGGGWPGEKEVRLLACKWREAHRSSPAPPSTAACWKVRLQSSSLSSRRSVIVCSSGSPEPAKKAARSRCLALRSLHACMHACMWEEALRQRCVAHSDRGPVAAIALTYQICSPPLPPRWRTFGWPQDVDWQPGAHHRLLLSCCYIAPTELHTAGGAADAWLTSDG
jgi:hypothetical protein